MNEITHEGSTTKAVIHIPPFDGLGSFKVGYKHEIKKPFPYLLKIVLTPVLHLEEIGGPNKFKITEVVCKYRIKVNDTLTAEDLAKVWNESGNYLVNTFNNFEEKRFGKKSQINISSVSELAPTLQYLVDWFYSIP
jgi:hypothetical protein